MAYNNVRIQQRLDSIENWTSSNPMLLSGEVAYVRFQDGSIRVKVGDGTSRFAQLKYLGEDEIITKHLSAIHISQGFNAYSSPTGLAGGAYVSAEAIFSQALGYNSTAKPGDDFSFVWNGDSTEVPGQLGGEDYSSHGKGTFNVNPLSGLSGFYIGDEPLADALGQKVWIKDIANPEYEDGKYSDISVIKIEKDEFDEKAAAEVPQLCSNTLYVVDSPYIDAYGQQLCNLTMSDDPEEAYCGIAATKQYVDAEISSIDVSKQLSGYVKLSSDIQQRVSSDMEINGFVSIGSLSVGSQATEAFQRLKELMQQKLSRLDPETASTFDIVSALQSIYLGGSI